MMYKIAVCDDEQVFADEIINKLQMRNKNYQIICFDSGEKLLSYVPDFDILFLDIEMPGFSGMETAAKLRESGYDGIIIFLTNHTELMPDAFKITAFNYNFGYNIEENGDNSIYGTAPDIYVRNGIEEYIEKISQDKSLSFENRLKWDNVLTETLEFIKEKGNAE